MTPVNLDIEIQQGDDEQGVYIAKDSTGTPIDLTNYTSKMVIAKTYDSATPLITLTDGSGTTITPIQGKFQWDLTHTQTDSLDEKNYVYDYRLIDPSNKVRRWLRGNFIVNPKVPE